MAVTKKGKKWYIVRSTGRRNEKGFYEYEWILTDATTKTEAKELESKLNLQRKKGFTPTKMKVSEYLDFWTEQHLKDIKDPCRNSTQEWYRNYIDNRIKPIIGHIKLVELTVLHIDEVLNESARNGCKTPTLRAIYSTMHAAFAWAVKKRLMEYNPVEYADEPEKAKRDYEYFDFKTANKFLEVAQNDYYYNFFLVAILTGLRANEIAGLKIQNIDFNNKEALIDHQVEEPGSDPIMGPTKAEKIYRIPLTPKVMEAIESELIRNEEKKRNLEKRNSKLIKRNQPQGIKKWEDNKLIFCNLFGGAIDISNVSHRNFKRILIKAQLSTGIRLHDCRHSFSTMLSDLGVPAEIISDLLGHSYQNFSKQTYTHAQRTKVKRLAVIKLEKAIFPNITSGKSK